MLNPSPSGPFAFFLSLSRFLGWCPAPAYAKVDNRPFVTIAAVAPVRENYPLPFPPSEAGRKKPASGFVL
jgi:hypothetical protein